MAVLAQSLVIPGLRLNPAFRATVQSCLVQRSCIRSCAVGNVLQQLSTPTLESTSELFLRGHGKSLRVNSLFANFKIVCCAERGCSPLANF